MNQIPIPTHPPVSRLTGLTELTDHAHKLLKILRGTEIMWMNRKDIARAIGKRRLTPYDIALLELLQEKGLVEIERRENGTPIGYEWVYHAPAEAKVGK